MRAVLRCLFVGLLVAILGAGKIGTVLGEHGARLERHRHHVAGRQRAVRAARTAYPRRLRPGSRAAQVVGGVLPGRGEEHLAVRAAQSGRSCRRSRGRGQGPETSPPPLPSSSRPLPSPGIHGKSPRSRPEHHETSHHRRRRLRLVPVHAVDRRGGRAHDLDALRDRLRRRRRHPFTDLSTDGVASIAVRDETARLGLNSQALAGLAFPERMPGLVFLAQDHHRGGFRLVAQNPHGVAATHLFRIAQEAVANAGKHAHASKVEVRLRQDRGEVVLDGHPLRRCRACGHLRRSRQRRGGDQRVELAVQRACSEIYEMAMADSGKAGMGTTLTALATLRTEPSCVIAHIGDSRAYRLRGTGDQPGLVQLTQDHTWVQQQVEAGALSPDAARVHPWSSILNRVLGMEQPGDADIIVAGAQPGDTFLLCSDGLSGMITDADIAAILVQALPLDGLQALPLALGRLAGGIEERRHGEQEARAGVLELVGELAEQHLGLGAVGDVVLHVHRERAHRQQAARHEVPLQVGVDVGRQHRLQVRVAGGESRIAVSGLRGLARRLPVVVLNRRVSGLPCVHPDNARGVRRAVQTCPAGPAGDPGIAEASPRTGAGPAEPGTPAGSAAAARPDAAPPPAYTARNHSSVSWRTASRMSRPLRMTSIVRWRSTIAHSACAATRAGMSPGAWPRSWSRAMRASAPAMKRLT